ncbi:hypothetical protein EW146_g3518 [Bondarzewia mesenterica]|uniref:Potassium transport protein n=1 Tax=Bondarzewia mesenterica TaxID=1095465 RepID=A0A4S4LZ54_9AGAM|nr:hypothetical protein EW146_g3518 [Bondarzewia mesenterica]
MLKTAKDSDAHYFLHRDTHIGIHKTAYVLCPESLLNDHTTITPIVLAAIAFASNGRFPESYVDIMFCCISAITGTGLTTLDLSALTAWQQTILLFIQLVGSPTQSMRHRYQANQNELGRIEEKDEEGLDSSRGRLKPDMIRRIDTTLKPVSPDMHIGDTLKPYSGTSPERFTSSPTALSITHELPDDNEQDLADQLSVTTSRAPSQRQRVEFNVPRSYTMGTRRKTIQIIDPKHHTDDDFGGFGDPLKLFMRLFNRLFPNFQKMLKQTMTMPAESTLVPVQIGAVPDSAKTIPYFSFQARVRKNSMFYGLSDDDCEELGGVEYKSLTALLWIVPLYYLSTLVIAFVVIAPYMSLHRWKDNFRPPQQHRVINPVWYSAFEVVGAWANTGMSLVDQSLVPFQTAYPMLILLMWVAIAGNTGFPIIVTDWVFFLILDIGNPTVEAIPVGTRLLLGAVQAVAVRLAGFQSIPISALAPAVKVLYLVMMYVSAYPVAMSVRSTNVYEERSLGVFEEEVEDDEDIEDEKDYPETDSRVSIWGRYLARHARRQLAFGQSRLFPYVPDTITYLVLGTDMWWLAFAVFLVCIIERHQINDTENESWFNIFSVVFEIVSAYSTVGLSLGTPTANYSLSGAMHTLSKLIICAVMLRGRHRGLPVAVDRAIMLPKEFLDKASAKAKELKRRQVEKSLASHGPNGRS